MEVLENTRTPEEMFDAIFKSRSFDYLILPEECRPAYERFYSPSFQGKLRKEFAAGGYGLLTPERR